MNYSESVNFLNNVSKTGSKLGLDSINRLLDKLGNPHTKLNAIHVAGTNGKGSVCNIIYSLLLNSGYSVAMYNSPHILKYNESITINDTTITDTDFALYTTYVKNAYDKIVSEGYNPPTVFECLTAIAFLYFSKNNLDFIIVETGLGGMDDATNVFSDPILSIITSISYDHTDFLGSTLEDIARIKAGIIKKKCPVVVGPNEANVISIIKDIATKNDSPFYFISSENINSEIHSYSYDGFNFSVVTPYYCYNNLQTNLIGNHQLENIYISLTAISIMNNNSITQINDTTIYNTLCNIDWSCRGEFIKSPENILLDGAHNSDGMVSLTEIIKKYFSKNTITLVFGVLKDKDVNTMLKTISPYINKIILTTPQNDRAMNVHTLYEHAIKYLSNIIVIPDKYEAIDYALSHHKKNELICCAGSLYLVTPLREYIRTLN
jgi:dihydrofolate synthase/folylpolyglutamate synthase